MPAGASTHPHTDCCSSPHSSRLCHTPTARPPRHPRSPSSRHPLVRRRRPLSSPSAPPSKRVNSPAGPRPLVNPRQSSAAHGAPPSKSIQISDPVRALLDPPYNLYENITKKQNKEKVQKSIFWETARLYSRVLCTRFGRVAYLPLNLLPCVPQDDRTNAPDGSGQSMEPRNC